jgi:hypothetical protein
MDIRNGLLSVYNGVSASVGTSNAFDIYKSTSGYVRIFNNGRLWIGNGTPVDAGYQMDVRGISQFTENINVSAGKRITWDTSNFVTLGHLATGSGIAIGNSATASGGGIAIGNNAGATTHVVEVAIGNSAKVAGGFEPATAIGFGTYAGGNSIAMNTAFAAAGNTFIAGSGWDGKAITNVYFGSGIERGSFYNGSLTYWSGSGTGYTINGAGAFGVNLTGGSLGIAGGKGTGIGDPGDIVFSTSITGSTGGTLQSLVNRWWIKGHNGTLTNRNIHYSSSAFNLDVTGSVRFATTASFTGSVLISGSLFLNGINITGASGSGTGTGLTVASGSTAATLTQIYSVLTGSARAAFYNYAALSESNARAGQISAVWFGSTASYNEVSTTDIGNTNSVVFRVAISGSFVNLNVTASAGWSIRTTAILV